MGDGNPFLPFTINFLTNGGVFGDMNSKEFRAVACNEAADVSAMPPCNKV